MYFLFCRDKQKLRRSGNSRDVSLADQPTSNTCDTSLWKQKPPHSANTFLNKSDEQSVKDFSAKELFAESREVAVRWDEVRCCGCEGCGCVGVWVKMWVW